MKSKNIFLGIIILFVGVVALLSSLEVITLNWMVVLHLWPMLLILLGISILPINDYFKAALLVLALGAGMLLYQHESGVNPGRYSFNISKHFGNWDRDDNNSDDDEFDEGPYSQQYSEPFDVYSKATLNVDFGSGEIEFEKPSAELVKVNTESNYATYDFKTESLGDEANVFISTKKGANSISHNRENEMHIALNDNPVWDFTISTGAADCDFDFSPYKVGDISIESGVCDMDIRLGDKSDATTLNIKSGVSDIDIKVPYNTGCKVLVDSGISDKDFKGFDKIERGWYQTKNFGQTEKQIIINLECGVSDISIERY